MKQGTKMLKKIPQPEHTLTPSCVDPASAVDYINSHIKENYCEKMSVDISFMNIIDACYVTTLCSTQHYIKYPNGKITWKVSSESVREFNKDLELGNSEYIL